MNQKKVSNSYTRKGRTLPCKRCGEPYADRIEPRVNPERGGYIICARCTMGLVSSKPKEVEINPDDFIKALEKGQLKKYRDGLGLSQKELAEKAGLSKRHLIRLENFSFTPGLKILRSIERKLRNVTSPCNTLRKAKMVTFL